jgi:hypothetical protein
VWPERRAGRLDEAAAALSEATRRRQELEQRDPANLACRLEYLASRTELGQVSWEQGDYAGGHQQFWPSLEALHALPDEIHRSEHWQESLYELERSIADRYGSIGIWRPAQDVAQRNVRYHRRGSVSDRDGGAREDLLQARQRSPADSHIRRYLPPIRGSDGPGCSR